MATKKTSTKASSTSAKKTAKKAVKRVAKKATKSSKAKEPEFVFNVQDHALVPKHEVLSEEEILAFFEQYDVQPTNLPTIYVNDAALKGLDAKIGDIIKISRTSHTAGHSVFYRRVAYE